MGHFDAPLSYDELLDVFKDALARVLSGTVLPPSCGVFTVPLTLALLDIVHAVREDRATEDLVARACGEFAKFAADQGTAQWMPEAQHTPKLAG